MATEMIKFTDDFVAEWNGKVLNENGRSVNFDGRYGIQCMDLWNFWCEEIGLTNWPRHVDAAAVWEDFNGAHYNSFDGILPDQPAKKGDVFIYNRSAWGTGFGHIGIVLADNGDTITVLECNGLGDGFEDAWMNQYGSPARIHTWPKTNLYGYLRWIDGLWAEKPQVVTQAVPPGRYWVVDPGDSISAIASNYQIDVASILNLPYNKGITNADQIEVGQFIDIPETRAWDVEYGDTLAGIADYFGVGIDDLARYNGIINADSIDVGQRIFIPS